MPTIIPSADLRNRYNEISALCHEKDEPIYVTKNGRGDLAIMSIDAYEKIHDRLELYMLLSEGLEDIKNGKTRPADNFFAEFKREHGINE